MPRLTVSQYFSLVASLFIVTAGVLLLVYTHLPRDDYLPAGLGVMAVATALVYLVLTRVARL